MANQIVTDTTITVHGRGSLVIEYKVKNAAGTQIDISGWTLFFEVKDSNIREALVSDPNDALGKRIVLERTQVELLNASDSQFSVIDETNAGQDIYRVLWSGTIKRVGYVV
jgi:hypothetical protein